MKKVSEILFMKNILYFFFVYMILEGVLRKWFFPIFSNEIYFIKDILLIIIYALALKQNLIFNTKYSKIFVFIILLISLYGFFGYEFNKNGIVSYFLGLRSYWLYLPLTLIVINVFDKNDLIKFFKLNLYFVLPYFVLIILQAKLPESSILNSGYQGNLFNPERPSGYFTYTTQNTYYFLFLFLCFCSFILSKKELTKKDIILLSILNILLFAIMILLKSRAVYVYVFTTLIYTSFFLVFSKIKLKIKLKKIFLILLVSIISFNILSKTVLEEETKYSTVRINTDTYYEMPIVTQNKSKEIKIEINLPAVNVKIPIIDDTVMGYCSKYSSICRIMNELYIVPAYQEASTIGKGIGAGTRLNVLYNKLKFFELGETENSRIVMELGNIVGPILIFLKVLIVIMMNFYALYRFREIKNLIFIPIVIFLSVQILIGPITYTTSFISFIFWFSLGLFFLAFNDKKQANV